MLSSYRHIKCNFRDALETYIRSRKPPKKVLKDKTYTEPLRTASIHQEIKLRLAKALAKTPSTPTVPDPQPKPSRPLPSWVPTESPDRPEDTGWIANPDSKSWIAGLKYTRDRGAEMTVRKGGKDYPYPGFNLEMFRRWVQSRSKGKWWWRNIGYPMMDAAPHKLSRFTGIVHPIFTPQTDSAPTYHPFYPLHKGYTPNAIMDWAQRHINPTITPAHLSAMIGWLPGTETYVHHEGPLGLGHQLAGHEPTNLTFNTTGPGFDTSRTLFSRTGYQDNSPRIQNDHTIIGYPGLGEGLDDLSLPPQPNAYRGVSGPNLLRQMRAAYEMGIPRIHWHSAWSVPGMNAGTRFGDFTGGLHWPEMGADGYIPGGDGYIPGGVNIPQHIAQGADELSGGRFSNTRLFSDFFKSPEAKLWYHSNPMSHRSFVDTTPGSYSRVAIERHVGENAAKHGMAGPLHDAAMYQIPHEHTDAIQHAPTERTLTRFQKLLFSRLSGRPRYHEALEHLISTGSCHPDYFDQYFNC